MLRLYIAQTGGAPECKSSLTARVEEQLCLGQLGRLLVLGRCCRKLQGPTVGFKHSQMPLQGFFTVSPFPVCLLEGAQGSGKVICTQ